jgi:hypothetical protein
MVLMKGLLSSDVVVSACVAQYSAVSGYATPDTRQTGVCPGPAGDVQHSTKAGMTVSKHPRYIHAEFSMLALAMHPPLYVN